VREWVHRRPAAAVLSAFTPEGQWIPGAGIKITDARNVGMFHISVAYEDYHTNPLVKAWVDALGRISDAAQWEKDHKKQP
jgi:hypothetical protein